MADTRRKHSVGTAIPGFKPGQAGYTVGPDKTIAAGGSSFTVHVTIDGMATSGKWHRVVRSFHLSFKGITPQPVGKWSYNPSTDKYHFTGWANYARLGIAAAAKPAFLQKVNATINGLKTVFGSAGFGPAT